MKATVKNLWVQPIVKKTCTCGQKKVETYSLGEYINAKWRTIDHFCAHCFEESVLRDVVVYQKRTGNNVRFGARSGYSIPEWIKQHNV